MYFARIENNEVKGFYSSSIYRIEELEFDYLIIDEELQNHIRNNEAFIVDEATLINLTDDEELSILTIRDKDLFKKIDEFEKR